MLDMTAGVEVGAYAWEGTAEVAPVTRGGSLVAKLIRKGARHKARVYPMPGYPEHWIDVHAASHETAVAAAMGALAVLAEKQEEGLF